MRFLSWRPGQATSRRVCADCPEPSGTRRPARLEHHISTGLRRLSVLCGTGLRRMGAALALGLFAATGFAAGAEAQSVLVSNDGQSDATVGDVGIVKLNSIDIAQTFTTGADGNGYTLSSVVIDFAKLGDRDVIASKLTASINANNSGVPGTSLGTLTASNSSRDVLTFSAGPSGISLEANTTYFFTIDVTEALNKNNRLRIAANSAVDAGGVAGWSIGNRRTRDRTVSGAWSSSSSSASSLPFKITINGEVNTPGVTVTPAALEVTEGATATYDVVLDTAPTGNVVITPTSSATAKATVSPATLTFTSSNWNQAQPVTVNGVAAGSANISHQVTTSADTTNYPTSMSIDPVAVTVTGPPVISITGGSALVEGANATFTVTSTPAPATDLTVKLSVADFADSDFLAAENEGEKSVTIPAGRSSVVYKFPTVADSKAEVAGDVSVTLLDGTGYTLNSDASKASIKILSRDKATLTFSSATATATEGAGAVTITASLDHTPDTELFLGDPRKLFPGRKKPTDINTSFGFTGTKLDPDFPFTFSYDDDNVDRPDREIILDLARSALLSDLVNISDFSKRALVELGTQASMTLTLIDNDPTAVTLARVGSGAVNEGGTAEFTVTLGRALVAGEIIDVPLSVSGAGVTTDDWSLALKTGAGRNTGVVLSGETTATPSLRFSGAAAETARLVLTATPDKVTETGGETLSVALGPDDATANGFDRTSLATNVGGGADPDTGANAFTLTVNEVPGVTVTETGGSTTVSEDGTVTDSYQVVLATQPSANVTIAVTSDDTDVATVDTNTLTFTSSNWNQPQTVTVTGVDDAVDQSADRTVSISHVATSADTIYGGIAVDPVSVTVSDDDMAGVTVTETILNVEEGGSGTYTLVLDSEPTQDVTIAVAPSSRSVATASPATLTFTADNWNTAQQVTVRAVDNSIVIPGLSVFNTGIHHTVTSSDDTYDGIEVASVRVAISDDDEVGVTVTETEGGTTVSEDGTVTDSYQVVLATQPSANVTIAVTSDDTDAATVDTNTLTFTSGNWNQPQSVTVTGVDDAVDQSADRRVSISHVATSDDTAYGGIEVASVSVTVSDDDEAGVIITETDGGTVVGNADSRLREDTYQVVLATQPTHDVMIAVTSGNVNGARVKKSGGSEVGSLTLTFTPDTWNTAQTVTVIGYGNRGDGRVSISHVATSDDTAYGGISVDPVSVAVANVIRTPGSLRLEEGDSGTYTLVLATQPSADVTIALSGVLYTVTNHTNEVTFAPAALTFTADTWNTAQQVTVTAVDNDVVDSGEIIGAIVHEATSSDGTYDGISYVFGVSVSDDDMAGVTVTETILNVEEGGSGTYTLVLDSQPSADVTIAVTSDDTDVATVDTNTLTFTSGNWNQPQSVTVTGVDDAVDQSADRTVSISHAATSDDTAYGGIEVASVSVTVSDDDMAGVTVTETEGGTTVSEDGTLTDSYQVVLTSEPSANVTIAVTSGDMDVATVDSDTLTFTSGNWNQPQTVTVTGVDDTVDQSADRTVRISHVASSADGSYGGIPITDVSVTVRDDDSALAERVVRPALARFGRTVGEQVLDAVTDRLGAARTPGFEGRFAGEALPDVICDDGKSAPDHVLEDDDRRRKCVGQGRYEPGSGRPADPSVAAWSNGLTGGPGGTPEVQAKETSDILPGTSFALTSETENGAALAFWGRGAQSGFSGRAGDLGLEGEVTSFMLGADQARDDWLFGLMLSRSRGEIDYTLGAASGEMETDLTALVPYMGWDVSDRLSVWGAAGLGSGDMRLRPEDGSEFRTDIDWGMAAAGADGALGSVAALGGAELRWLADALWTRTTSDAVPGLEATSGSTTRLRLGLESRWEHSFASAATLSPRLETGLRYDGGDAETGFGLEVGGGVEFTDPSRGLSLGLRGRTLALHQDGNFEDWGLALDLAYDPTPETKRGFAARLSHTFGGASSGGVDALLGPRLFPEASPTGDGDRSWSVEAAYGVSRGRGRVGSPYTTITAAGSGSATGARLGYRIEPDADHAADVNLDFWTEPPTTANDRASGGATLQWKW